MRLHSIFLMTLVSISGLAAVEVVSHAETANTAQPTLKQSVARVKNKCDSEIKKLCSNVTPGEGRIASCLDSKENQLSDSCKATWLGAKENISKRLDKADVQFRKDCGTDVQKFCSEVPSGKGRLLSCLNQHQPDLSNSCRNFQTKLEQKFDEFIS